jgi:uncharacterized protein (TIGR02217 family)
MSFLESPRFPEGISYGSSGGPGFKTHIFEGHTGIEQRSQIWSISKGRWDVAHGIKDKEDMDVLRAFFYNTRGRALGFRFKDHADYTMINEQIGVGDGANRVFPLIKTYAGGNPYVRRIFKPIASTVEVRVAGVLVSTPGNYALNSTLGIVTFNDSPAVIPIVGAAVTVTCEFDVPVRFDVDQMSASHDGWQVESWNSIPIVELLEDEEMT